jgi:hypothetical protein
MSAWSATRSSRTSSSGAQPPREAAPAPAPLPEAGCRRAARGEGKAASGCRSWFGDWDWGTAAAREERRGGGRAQGCCWARAAAPAGTLMRHAWRREGARPHWSSRPARRRRAARGRPSSDDPACGGPHARHRQPGPSPAAHPPRPPPWRPRLRRRAQSEGLSPAGRGPRAPRPGESGAIGAQGGRGRAGPRGAGGAGAPGAPAKARGAAGRGTPGLAQGLGRPSRGGAREVRPPRGFKAPPPAPRPPSYQVGSLRDTKDSPSRWRSPRRSRISL